MPTIKAQTVVVTGASSGIGEATARLLARRGGRVMLAARREGRLRRIAEQIRDEGGQADYQVTDVTQPEQVQALAREAEQQFGPIDVWINNAGVMPLSPLARAKVQDWQRTIQVNVMGVLHGIAAAVPGMLDRGRGHVINVASEDAHDAWPTGAVYCASKHAVRVISDVLRQETAGQLRVTVISPGTVATELPEKVDDPDGRAMIDDDFEVAMEPGEIAKAIAWAIEQPEEVSINEVLVRPTAQGS